MFGLMKFEDHCSYEEQRESRSLHYCGTCKTIGKLYGHLSRFSLNSDAVFLAEIISAISGENQKMTSRRSAYRPLTCFSFPISERQLPFSLQYAATANVMLTEIKLDDHVTDSNLRRWKFGQKLLSRSFQKAQDQMRKWDFPLSEIWDWVTTQKEREQIISRQQPDFNEVSIIDYLSEPTARMTALTFQYGAKMIDNEQVEAKLYKLGLHFGRLVYILDALEDYEKDNRDNSFNALEYAYRCSNGKLPRKIHSNVIQLLEQLKEQVVSAIHELPVSRIQTETFIKRLDISLSRRLYSKPILPSIKLSIAERWFLAKKTVNALIKEKLSIHDVPRYKLSAMTFLSTMMIFLFPRTCYAQTTVVSSDICSDVETQGVVCSAVCSTAPCFFFFQL